MREGYKEIEISNTFNSGIIKTIKVCNGCKFIEKMIMSGKYISTCNHDNIFNNEADRRSTRLVNNRRLQRNLHGYMELPDDGCPFENQIKRDKKLSQLLNKQK